MVKIYTIKRRREGLNITQEELAKRLGLTQGAISQWENGITMPNTSILLKLAEIFDCTVDELLGIEKTPAEKQA